MPITYLRVLRVSRGIAPTDLVKAYQVSPATISNVETVRRVPPPDTAIRLHRVLGDPGPDIQPTGVHLIPIMGKRDNGPACVPGRVKTTAHVSGHHDGS
jgi:transcriptional regulator with XRE-family HTH domain